MTIWFATGNRHKKEELAAILPDHHIRIPSEAGIDFDPQETGNSFPENALIKARELYRLISGFSPGEPVIADDSGLCVDALGGRPGIYSARYGGPAGGAPVLRGGDGKTGDSRRNAQILKDLGDSSRRSARFVCAMVLLLGEDRFFIARKPWRGNSSGKAEGAAASVTIPSSIFRKRAAPWRNCRKKKKTVSVTGERPQVLSLGCYAGDWFKLRSPKNSLISRRKAAGRGAHTFTGGAPSRAGNSRVWAWSSSPPGQGLPPYFPSPARGCPWAPAWARI